MAVRVKTIGGARQDLGKRPRAVLKYQANVPDHLWGGGGWVSRLGNMQIVPRPEEGGHGHVM